jgi:hypothetical protein
MPEKIMEIDQAHVDKLVQHVVDNFYEPAHQHAIAGTNYAYPGVDIQDEKNEGHPASLMYYTLLQRWQVALASKALEALAEGSQ